MKNVMQFISLFNFLIIFTFKQISKLLQIEDFKKACACVLASLALFMGEL